MSVTVTRTAFSKGEITPRLYGRTDVEAFFYALQKAENLSVLEEGGIRNRVGTRFIAPVKTHDKRVRLVPFNFGGVDTHVLEFGDQYIRILRDDYHVTETPINITGISKADPCVVTAVGHGLSTGDEVFIENAGGMVEINFRRFKVTVLTADTVSLQSQYDGTDIDSSAYTTYTSGGTIAKIYEIATPYDHNDVFDIKFSQSFDVVYLRHPSYPPKNLRRLGVSNWELVDAIPEPTVPAPTGVAMTVGTSGSVTYRYAVTAVSGDTGEESLAGLSGSPLTITGITQANPAVITLSAATTVLRTGHEVELSGITGMTELNGLRVSVIRLSSTQFQLRGIDSTGFGAYVSGGSCAPAFVHTASGATTANNTISWNAVAGANKYVVYREEDGLFAFLAETQDLEYNDKGGTDPDLNDTVPAYRNPFFGVDNYPAAIGSFNQRAIEGGSNNAKATLDFSVSGAFSNFNRSIKPKDDDAFRITIDALSESQIRHLAKARDLMVLSESSIKRVYTGGQALTFNTVAIEGPEETGASQVRPIVYNQKVLFEDNLKTGIYAAEFSFAVDAVNIEQLSAFSEHLWATSGLVDWTRVKGENQFIFGTRGDGQGICFTYNPGEQFQVNAFTRWTTDGLFKSTTSVRNRLNERTESLYFVVERQVNGNTVQYIEVIKDEHDPLLIEDAFYVDSGLSYADEVTVEAVSSDAEAVFTATSHGFSNDQEVRLRGFNWRGQYDSNFNLSVPNHFNGIVAKVKNATTNTFKLQRVEDDSYLSGVGLPEYLGSGKAGRRSSKLYGFDHLVGKTVACLLDGDVTEDLTVNADGSVDLPRPGAVVAVGLRYVADLQTLPLVDLRGSIEQSKESSLRELYIDTYLSRGMLVGPRFERLTPWAQRTYEAYGEPTRRKTGVSKIGITSEWSSEAALCIRQRDPLPLTIRSISIENEQPR